MFDVVSKRYLEKQGAWCISMVACRWCSPPVWLPAWSSPYLKTNCILSRPPDSTRKHLSSAGIPQNYILLETCHDHSSSNKTLKCETERMTCRNKIYHVNISSLNSILIRRVRVWFDHVMDASGEDVSWWIFFQLTRKLSWEISTLILYFVLLISVFIFRAAAQYLFDWQELTFSYHPSTHPTPIHPPTYLRTSAMGI